MFCFMPPPHAGKQKVTGPKMYTGDQRAKL